MWLSGLGLFLLVLGLWRLNASHEGLLVHSGVAGDTPFQLLAPEDALSEPRPLVLIAHGLAGSGTIMDGLALSFAHAGYAAVSWDFNGHGKHPAPMEEDIYSPWLLHTVERVWAAVADHPAVDTTQLAIVGHSMGTAAALSFAQTHPETRTTVAISPVGRTVTPELPQNLLLLAGELEPRFVENARDRLEEAGGIGGSHEVGSARGLHIVPGVEHISIILAPSTHELARNWLGQSFGVQRDARDYVDRRFLWYGLMVLGTLILATAAMPRFTTPAHAFAISVGYGSVVLVAAGLMATLLLWLAGLLGLSLNTLFGIRAGGYLILWFLIAGGVGLLLLKPLFTRPQRQELLNGIALFGVFWVGIGLAGGVVWLPWLLIFKRLVLWPLVTLALLPWCLLVGELSAQGQAGSRLAWWLGQSMVLFSALTLAIKLSPELGFLGLLLPVFPVVLLLHVIPNMVHRGAWIYAISGSMFVSWMLLAVFPLI